MSCDQCDAVTINGVYCHEHGCPNKCELFTFPECDWCGKEFLPEFQGQTYCCTDCATTAVEHLLGEV